MLRRSSARISIILHTLLFLIVASSALNYWSVAEYAIKVSWNAYYYQKGSYISLVPNWQKGLKDLFAFLLLLGSLWFPATIHSECLVKKKGLTICYTLSLIILGIAIARSISSSFTLEMIISSLRPFLPLVAVFVFCHRHFQPYYLRWVLETLSILALIQVFYAYLQRQSALKYDDLDWLNSGTARAVGTFIAPNSMALFLALVFYINLFILPTHKWRFLMFPLCGVGIFFTGSRTGLLIVFILLAIAFYKKIKKTYKIDIFKDRLSGLILALPVIFTLLMVTVSNVNSISGRASSSTTSDGRLEMFKSLVNESDILSLLFGNHLGFGSNIVQTLASNSINRQSFFLSDSTVSSVLGQFGIGGILVLFSIIYILLQSRSKIMYTQHLAIVLVFTGKLKKEKIGLLVYLISTLATIIIFEFYAVLPILICLLFHFQMPDIIFDLNEAEYSIN